MHHAVTARGRRVGARGLLEDDDGGVRRGEGRSRSWGALAGAPRQQQQQQQQAAGHSKAAIISVSSAKVVAPYPGSASPPASSAACTRPTTPSVWLDEASGRGPASSRGSRRSGWTARHTRIGAREPWFEVPSNGHSVFERRLAPPAPADARDGASHRRAPSNRRRHLPTLGPPTSRSSPHLHEGPWLREGETYHRGDRRCSSFRTWRTTFSTRIAGCSRGARTSRVRPRSRPPSSLIHDQGPARSGHGDGDERAVPPRARARLSSPVQQAAAAGDVPEPGPPAGTSAPAAAPSPDAPRTSSSRLGHEDRTTRSCSCATAGYVAVGRRRSTSTSETLEAAVASRASWTPGPWPGSSRGRADEQQRRLRHGVPGHRSLRLRWTTSRAARRGSVVATRSQIATGAAVSADRRGALHRRRGVLAARMTPRSPLAGVARGQRVGLVVDEIDDEIDKLVTARQRGEVRPSPARRALRRGPAKWQKAIAEKEKELEEDFKNETGHRSSPRRCGRGRELGEERRSQRRDLADSAPSCAGGGRER